MYDIKIATDTVMLCYYVTLYEELGFFLKEKAALHPTALLCNHLDKIL